MAFCSNSVEIMPKTTALASFGLRGARNPHVPLRTFRFLHSVRPQTSCARDVFNMISVGK